MRTLIIFGLIVGAAPAAWAQCQCDVTVPLATTTIDGTALGVQPGNTVCLTPGTSAAIIVRNMRGTSTQPVTLTSCGARTITGTTPTGFDLTGNAHLRVTSGTGDITLDGFSRGIFVRGGSTDIELDHLTFRNMTFVAIDVRTDPLCDGGFTRDAFTMEGLRIHHNTISDVGDAMYLGELACTGGLARQCNGPDAGETRLFPHQVTGVDVHDNLMERSRRTTLKIACSPDARVHHNVVRDYGTIDEATENNGLETRAGMSGSVDSNLVERGSGHGIFVKSAPHTRVVNNVVVDPEGFGIGATDSAGMTGWHLEHNTIVRPRSAAVRSFTGIDSGVVLNTFIVAPVLDGGLVSLPGAGWRAAGTLVVSSLDDAAFVDPDGGNFALQAGSPAIDVGVDASVAIDFTGAPRGARPDVGAFEFRLASIDAGQADDAGLPFTFDAGTNARPDAGTMGPNTPEPEEEAPVGCGCSGVGGLPALVAAGLLSRRRRRD